jgi:signal transduction histidine kinase
VARALRLRHKLVLGLALVVASVALLVSGTLFGLSSYLDMTRTTERKVDEIQQVAQLRDNLHDLAAYPGNDPAKEKEHIDRFLTLCQDTLTAYEQTLQNETLRLGLDPDGGETELDYIARLRAGFDRLRDAVGRASAPQVQTGGTGRVLDEPDVRDECLKLSRDATGLLWHIVGDIKTSRDRAAANHRRALYVVGSATALAVVLVLTLLYYFRVWVFAPIQQLQAGVHRVHTGDFDHPIRLASRDELEELANEFNAMTARLRDVYADLARQVEERSRQLVAAEKMVSVGFLAAGVAHEINNPMASIAFCAEALERRLHHALAAAPADSEVILKYLKMIEQEAFRCKQITDRLLNYSRDGAGRREAIDLAGPIQNQLDLLRHHPASRDRKMEFRHDGPVVATVDAHEFEGVVHNLVVNALEHTDVGGTVAVTLRPAADGAEVVVQDTGVGMPADVLRHIFEPFYTRSRTGQGTGLGLFICNRVVTEHGGTITASSGGPGKGSTFTVRLPVKDGRDSKHDTGGERPNVVPFPAAKVAAA